MLFKRCIKDGEKMQEFQESWRTIFSEKSQRKTKRSAGFAHAAKFAELLGEVVTASTEKNLSMRVDAENGATAGKFDLAKLAKELGYDAVHDTVHEMAKDEARHGRAFEGLLKRYFGK